MHPPLARVFERLNTQGDVEEGAVDALIARGGLGPFRRDGFFAYASARQVQVRCACVQVAAARRRLPACAPAAASMQHAWSSAGGGRA